MGPQIEAEMAAKKAKEGANILGAAEESAISKWAADDDAPEDEE